MPRTLELDRRAEVQDEIVKAVKLGASFRDAAMSAGICEATFHNYKAEALRAREKREAGKRLTPRDRKMLAFLEAVQKAEAEFKKSAVQRINLHGRKNWMALAWILDRRYPREFGRVERVIAPDESDETIAAYEAYQRKAKPELADEATP